MILLNFFIIEYSIPHLPNVIKSASSCAHNDHFKKISFFTSIDIKTQSCRANTNKKYTCYFNKWKSWSKQFEEEKFRVVLTSLNQQKSADVIESSNYTNQFFYECDLADNIFPSDICENIVEKKIVKRQRKRRNPLS